MDGSYDNCGTQFCDRPEADVERGCPDCLISQLTRELKDDCLQEFENLATSKGVNSSSWPWTFERVQQDVAIISNIDASVNNQGYNPEWTVRVKNLVSILRDQRYKAQRARMKEITSGRRNPEQSGA